MVVVQAYSMLCRPHLLALVAVISEIMSTNQLLEVYHTCTIIIIILVNRAVGTTRLIRNIEELKSESRIMKSAITQVTSWKWSAIGMKFLRGFACSVTLWFGDSVPKFAWKYSFLNLALGVSPFCCYDFLRNFPFFYVFQCLKLSFKSNSSSL